MECNYQKYNVEASKKRISDILGSTGNYTNEVDSIPSRNSLNYSNGYYVDVSALFIDIRQSSDLTDVHKRSTLAKIYRCFISECLAILSDNEYCKEVNIQGDCVWGVFNGKTKEQKISIINTAAKLETLIGYLNSNFTKAKIHTISVGIGIDCGRALMIQAGYKGKSENDVVWMGDVVNRACHYSDLAGKGSIRTIAITEAFFTSLSDDYKKFFEQYRSGIYSDAVYHATLYNPILKNEYDIIAK